MRLKVLVPKHQKYDAKVSLPYNRTFSLMFFSCYIWLLFCLCVDNALEPLSY